MSEMFHGLSEQVAREGTPPRPRSWARRSLLAESVDGQACAGCGEWTRGRLCWDCDHSVLPPTGDPLPKWGGSE